jgi:hypothetical protein
MLVDGPLLGLRQIRLLRNATQARVARYIGKAAPSISSMEHRAMGRLQVGVLQSYVESLGGELLVVAVFEDGTRWQLGPIDHHRRAKVSSSQESTST